MELEDLLRSLDTLDKAIRWSSKTFSPQGLSEYGMRHGKQTLEKGKALLREQEYKKGVEEGSLMSREELMHMPGYEQLKHPERDANRPLNPYKEEEYQDPTII